MAEESRVSLQSLHGLAMALAPMIKPDVRGRLKRIAQGLFGSEWIDDFLFDGRAWLDQAGFATTETQWLMCGMLGDGNVIDGVAVCAQVERAKVCVWVVEV
ncbi:MAG: hypothetical protein NXH81_05085 [Halieaceae bacterium]|jgi:hypothetical protein|uniref:hypothetical protein n=1 Tax=Haliea alexandrii TaxID=2448162 RepID=UPI000F0BA710|nr:hypothetical protein [Haliea alexandrii]MCR9184750.1 hypothetical protein [Halieaceae bacterium]